MGLQLITKKSKEKVEEQLKLKDLHCSNIARSVCGPNMELSLFPIGLNRCRMMSTWLGSPAVCSIVGAFPAVLFSSRPVVPLTLGAQHVL